MSALQFIAALVDALAWPAVVVVAVLIFRKKLAALLSRGDLSSLTAGPLKIEWQKAAAQVETLADDVARPALPQSADDETPDQVSEKVAELIEVSPEAAILMGFRHVEQALTDFAERETSERPIPTSLHRLIQIAADSGRLDRTAVEGLAAARTMRNLISHARSSAAFEVTPEVARNFLTICDLTVYLLGPGKGNS